MHAHAEGSAVDRPAPGEQLLLLTCTSASWVSDPWEERRREGRFSQEGAAEGPTWDTAPGHSPPRTPGGPGSYNPWQGGGEPGVGGPEHPALCHAWALHVPVPRTYGLTVTPTAPPKLSEVPGVNSRLWQLPSTVFKDKTCVACFLLHVYFITCSVQSAEVLHPADTLKIQSAPLCVSGPRALQAARTEGVSSPGKPRSP